MSLNEEDTKKALETLFASDGWKIVVQDLTDMQEGLMESSVEAAQTNEQWQFLRGAVTQLRYVIGIEPYMKAVWAQQENDKLENDDDK